MNDDKKVGMNEQDAPHKEGQYGNTSANPAAEENVSMGISQMNDENRSNQSRDENRPGQQQQSSGEEGRA